jgi:hypothetical protein
MDYKMTEGLLFTNAIFNDIAERKPPRGKVMWMTCPCCKGNDTLTYFMAVCNGHVHAFCSQCKQVFLQ